MAIRDYEKESKMCDFLAVEFQLTRMLLTAVQNIMVCLWIGIKTIPAGPLFMIPVCSESF